MLKIILASGDGGYFLVFLVCVVNSVTKANVLSKFLKGVKP
jgi:hypothetical protein